MRYVISLLALLVSFSVAAQDSWESDPVDVKVSQVKFADQEIATTAARKRVFVTFENDPFLAECGRHIDIRPEVQGVITGPLVIAEALDQTVRVRITDYDLINSGGCFLQSVTAR